MTSKVFLGCVILIMAVFAAGQQVLLMQYDDLNSRLQTALEKCAGIKRVE